MEKEIKLKNNGFINLFIALVLLFSPLSLIFYREVWAIPVFIFLPLLGILWLTGLFIIQPNQTSIVCESIVYIPAGTGFVLQTWNASATQAITCSGTEVRITVL